MYGTEDPRVTYDPATRQYYMFYTAYGQKPDGSNSVLLCEAVTTNPSSASKWKRLGPVFPSMQGSKSGALIVRDTGPHFLLWGDTSIRIALSDRLDSWPDVGQVFMSPREGEFDSILVESGPPPLRLSDGNYLFLYNSKGEAGYLVGWAILSGENPAQILARSSEPLLSPVFDWEKGVAPWTCNVENVNFLQGAAPTPERDVFRVYFGGADAVMASAVVRVSLPQSGGAAHESPQVLNGVFLGLVFGGCGALLSAVLFFAYFLRPTTTSSSSTAAGAQGSLREPLIR